MSGSNVIARAPFSSPADALAPGRRAGEAHGTADTTEAVNRQPAAGISFSCRMSSLLQPLAEAQAPERSGRLTLPHARAQYRDMVPNEMRRTMTTLKERLHGDVVSHMKDRNKIALTTVRNVLGEIETREKSGKTPVELTDAEVTSLLQKEAAKRRDTARIYTEAGENDRAAAEIAEAEIIEAYLPKALSPAEVEAIVDETIAALTADGVELSIRQLGAVMKPVTAKVAGRFDGKAVSEIVRNRIAQ
jgi:uncharacterized protein YqeY